MRIQPLFTSSAGVRHLWRDNGDGTQDVISSFDCEPILEANKAMATHNDGYSPDRTLRRVASIPLIIWFKWLTEEGWDAFHPAYADKLKQKLNSSDYAFLRTAPGQL